MVASGWLQLSVSGATGGSRPLAGMWHVKRRGKAPDFVTHLMLRYPSALTVVSHGVLAAKQTGGLYEGEAFGLREDEGAR